MRCLWCILAKKCYKIYAAIVITEILMTSVFVLFVISLCYAIFVVYSSKKVLWNICSQLLLQKF